MDLKKLKDLLEKNKVSIPLLREPCVVSKLPKAAREELDRVIADYPLAELSGPVPVDEGNKRNQILRDLIAKLRKA